MFRVVTCLALLLFDLFPKTVFSFTEMRCLTFLHPPLPTFRLFVYRETSLGWENDSYISAVRKCWWFSVSDGRAKINSLRSGDTHTPVFEYLVSPQVLIKKTSPILQGGSRGWHRLRNWLPASDTSVAEMEGELPSFLDPFFTLGKKNQHHVLGPGSSSPLCAGCGALSAPLPQPSTLPNDPDICWHGQ